MLKYRVIPTLLLKDIGLVKGKLFNNSRRVGSILPAIKVYNNREVDELVIFDISATINSRPPDFDIIASITPYCLMPLTVGGGITELIHIQKLLQLGVDKVTINTAAYHNLKLIEDAANKFGSQCIVTCIDAKKVATGTYSCFSKIGTHNQNLNPVQWAKQLENHGAGEILITSVEKDGTMSGYDLELISLITNAVNIPVIASGGAGEPEHAYQVITLAGASAVAAASIFHFTEQTPLSIKHYLSQKGVPVRKNFL
ncbi:MAG: Histidine biosynthesis protein HisF [uncultured bacterium]|nr:MAG: Histidine biosynthesis protein HisF [uncultured bacterium]